MKVNKQNFDISKFDVILFDFDGVLAASMNVKTEAFKTLFERFGDDVVQKVVKHHIENGGISRYEKIKYYYSEFLGENITQDEVDEIAEEFSRLVVAKVINASWIKGAKEFLEKYYKKMDFYVVSGTPQKELELIIQKRNMEKYFIEVCGTPDTKPEIAKRIIKENNCDKNRVLFIGDSLSDYRAAKIVDIPFLGVVSTDAKSPFPSDIQLIGDFSCFI